MQIHTLNFCELENTFPNLLLFHWTENPFLDYVSEGQWIKDNPILLMDQLTSVIVCRPGTIDNKKRLLNNSLTVAKYFFNFIEM